MRDTKPPVDDGVVDGFVSAAGACAVEAGAPGVAVVVVEVTPPGGSSEVADGITAPSDPGSPA